MGNKPSTIRGKLTGIRWHHLDNGLANPCEEKSRLSGLISSLKRIRGESTGKPPATPAQLRHIKSKPDFTDPRHVVAWAATTCCFFLCMRTSEYLAEGYTFDPVRSLTTDKIAPHWGDLILEDFEFEEANSLKVSSSNSAKLTRIASVVHAPCTKRMAICVRWKRIRRFAGFEVIRGGRENRPLRTMGVGP